MCKRLAMLVISIVFALLVADAGAGSCTGNACNDVVFSFEGGCYITTNHGTSRVKVRQGPYSFVLQRGESHKLLVGGQCVTGYVGDDSAYYEVQGDGSGNGCTKVRSIKELGWRKGHKTKFCIARGYQGVTNFPNGSYRSNGGGFCFTGDQQACLEIAKGING